MSQELSYQEKVQYIKDNVRRDGKKLANDKIGRRIGPTGAQVGKWLSGESEPQPGYQTLIDEWYNELIDAG